MSSCNQANIHYTIADFAQTPETFFFQDFEEFRLHLHINVADFIQEDSSLVRNFQQPALGCNGAGECALFMPKQFGFEKLAAQAGAIQVYKSFIGAGGVLVHPSCQNALSGAGFSLDQYWTLSSRNFSGFLFQLADQQAGADKRIDFPAARLA